MKTAPHHALLACKRFRPPRQGEGQLARETLLQWVPVMQDCLSLLSLPLSLQAGEIRLTLGNFGNQIVDFADRAMRLRCCNQREAWNRAA